jgi:protein transport protein SEC23
MVHELSYDQCPKSYVFRGSKDYQPKQIIDMLGLNPSNRMAAPRPGQPMPAPAASKFLLPVQACEFQLTNILEGLQRDPWPVEQDKRPLRCTGVALGVATALLEVSHWVTSNGMVADV